MAHMVTLCGGDSLETASLEHLTKINALSLVLFSEEFTDVQKVMRDLFPWSKKPSELTEELLKGLNFYDEEHSERMAKRWKKDEQNDLLNPGSGEVSLIGKHTDGRDKVAFVCRNEGTRIPFLFLYDLMKGTWEWTQSHPFLF